jgi:hypothetical protein
VHLLHNATVMKLHDDLAYLHQLRIFLFIGPLDT